MDVDIQNLTEAVDRLADAGPLVPADPESMEALMCLRARVDAIVTEAAASFEASGDWAPDGAKTAAAWLGRRCTIPVGQARAIIRRGRVLSHLPAFARAWSSGAINAAHIDAVVAVRNPSTEEALARDEEVLCDQAASLPSTGSQKRSPTGTSSPTPTGQRRATRSAWPPGTSIWKRASTACGSGR